MFDMVQSYLSNSDRIRCSRASKDFLALLSPYAHCIRTLRVRTYKSLSPFVTAEPEKLMNLRNLEIMLQIQMESEYWAFQSIENYKAYKAIAAYGLDDDFDGLNWGYDD
ncbi:hypothetical protein BGZ51_003976 [Haplosporangium sp. Z 767]|nr:hypothetical protein BGZ51_003976 [Haplosporangium sp. Z 767]